MKNTLAAILLCAWVSGCASTLPRIRTTEVASNNRNNLSKLAVGMAKQAAMDVMGEQAIKARCWLWGVSINNPYKTEILEEGKRKFEVLYYYTNTSDTDCSVSEDDLTPVVFENGRLIGRGDIFLRQLPVMRYLE